MYQLRHPSRNSTPQRRAFSLVELLMVVAVLGVLVAVAIPAFNPSAIERLNSAAEVVVADLDYVRNLAVTNGSTYRLTFNATDNTYTLKHVGSETSLNALPKSLFHRQSDGSTEHVYRMADLPSMGPPVRIVGALAMASVPSSTTQLEFGSLGQTSRSETTIVWLTAGSGSEARYLPISVDPVTGLATMGKPTTTAPSGL